MRAPGGLRDNASLTWLLDVIDKTVGGWVMTGDGSTIVGKLRLDNLSQLLAQLNAAREKRRRRRKETKKINVVRFGNFRCVLLDWCGQRRRMNYLPASAQWLGLWSKEPLTKTMFHIQITTCNITTSLLMQAPIHLLSCSRCADPRMAILLHMSRLVAWVASQTETVHFLHITTRTGPSEGNLVCYGQPSQVQFTRGGGVA